MTSFSVVVPAFQAEATLKPCLDGLAIAGFDPSCILVVDDGSSDRTSEIAEAFGARVIRNGTSLRPARARNRGVDAVDGDVVVFVDADVVLTSQAKAQLAAHFARAEVAAVIGSYDDRASGGSVVSDYRNLLHHHVHQRAAGSSQTFWTGIGAVRRSTFVAEGGLRREWENIEDVEFGLRVTESGGRIVLDPNLQGTHLKVWTPASMFRTDLFGRAVPWSRLLMSGRAAAGRLNTSLGHQISASGVICALAGLLLWPFWAPALWILLAGLVTFVAASGPLLATLSRVRGPVFALKSLPWHLLHYLAAIVGLILVALDPRSWRRDGSW